MAPLAHPNRGGEDVRHCLEADFGGATRSPDAKTAIRPPRSCAFRIAFNPAESSLTGWERCRGRPDESHAPPHTSITAGFRVIRRQLEQAQSRVPIFHAMTESVYDHFRLILGIF